MGGIETLLYLLRATGRCGGFLRGFDVEVEHIIPKSLYFDDSFANKVCSCRSCNKEKNNRTAYDYMKSKGEKALSDYVERVNTMYTNNQISKTKWQNLLTPVDKISTDFIDRQLRESQYIARKAKEILTSVCYNVTATSGSVTSFLRHVWGWDTVLHDLNFDRYKKVSLTEVIEVNHRGSVIRREQIKDWSKRFDHRHHAIDALTIACTKQAYIQRLNNLRAEEGPDFNKMSLERYIQSQPHFSVAQVREAVDRILVSFRAGKRAVTPGKRYIRKNRKRISVQSVLIPRGALSEDSVYGVIHVWEKDEQGHVIQKQRAVMKYPITSINREMLDKGKVVDKRIHRILSDRLAQYNDNPKEAFAKPVYIDKECRIPIRTVRCFAKPAINTLVPLKKDDKGNPVAWGNPGNNHHVAIYRDEDGKYKERTVTFWEAVDRCRVGIPAIVTQPDTIWDNILQRNDISENVLESLPNVKWQFVLSLQQNEMFILGMNEEDYRYAMDQQDYALLNKYLYRVQKLSKGDYSFRYHTETSVEDKYDGKPNLKLSTQIGKLKRVRSLEALFNLHPHKVHISVLGEIKEIS